MFKSKFILYIFGLSMFLFINSCSKRIELDQECTQIPYTAANVKNVELIRFPILLSQCFNDPIVDTLKNANVILIHNDSLIPLLPGGMYTTSNNKVWESGRYQLKYKVDGFEEVSGEFELFESAQFSQPNISNQPISNSTALVQFEIKDDSSKENFYEVTVLENINGHKQINHLLAFNSTIVPTDEVILREGDYEFEPESIVISDKGYNGKDILLHIPIRVQVENGIIKPNDNLYVEVRTIDGQSFLLYKSLIRLGDPSFTLGAFQSPFASMVYSNMSNHIGYFVGYSSIIKKILF